MLSRLTPGRLTTARILVASLFALASLTAAYAQVDRATVNGIVKDANGALVSGAKVTLASTNTGLTRETTTNSDVFFAITYVPVGAYKLTASQSGFATAKVDNVTLGPGDTRRFEISLKIGAVDSVIDVVDTESGPIDSASPTVGMVIRNDQVQNRTSSTCAANAAILNSTCGTR